MQIPVLGMDPSLRHWGLAEANLDLTDGVLSTPVRSIVEPTNLTGKNIRVNTNDQWLAEQLSIPVLEACRKAKAIFVEVPVGSQSARAMASYGICIQVMPAEVKRVFTGRVTASKKQMIEQLIEFYPDVVLPKGKAPNKYGDKSEHIADATAAIHSGVLTSEFQTLLRILQKG